MEANAISGRSRRRGGSSLERRGAGRTGIGHRVFRSDWVIPLEGPRQPSSNTNDDNPTTENTQNDPSSTDDLDALSSDESIPSATKGKEPKAESEDGDQNPGVSNSSGRGGRGRGRPRGRGRGRGGRGSKGSRGKA